MCAVTLSTKANDEVVRTGLIVIAMVVNLAESVHLAKDISAFLINSKTRN